MTRQTLRKIVKVVIGIVLSAAASFLIDHILQEHYRKIAVGRDTTYVLGPTFDDGYVDFLSALDARFSQGVTPEKNAAVDLFKAIGLKTSVRTSERAKIVAGLKMADLPDNGTYFTGYYDMLIQQAQAAAHGKFVDDSGFSGSAFDQELLRSKAPWSANDDPQTAQWLRLNAIPLDLAVEASKCPRYYCPLVGRPGLGTTLEASLPSLGSIREISLALACRSMLAISTHDYPSWRSDFLAQQRLGRLLMAAPTVIQVLVGKAIVEQANGQLPSAIPTLTASQARETLSDLQALPPLPDIVDCYDQGERLMIIAEISTLARFGPVDDFDRAGTGPLPKPAWFGFQAPVHFNDLLRQYNQNYDRFIAAARAPTYSQRVLGLAKFDSDRRASLAMYSGSNSTEAIQRLIFQTLGHAANPVLAQDLARENARLGQLALQLWAYKLDHGTFPTNLAQVGAADGADHDLFADDSALHYQLNSDALIIYSIGPNQRDDGGKLVKPPVDRKAIFSFDDPAPAIKSDYPDDLAIRLPLK